MNRKVSNKVMTLLICVLFMIVSTLSIAFAIDNIDHDCNDHGCVICTQLHSAENLLKQLAISVVGAAFIYGALNYIWNHFQNITIHVIQLTPISSKVRMNN